MSISGGRSSAMLAKLLIDTKKLKRVDVVIGGFYVYTKYVNDTEEYVFVFANTSREKELTLLFMRDIENYWGIKVHWVEAVVDFRKGKGTRHRIVSFKTAKRKGEVFEEVIEKYGIPNPMFIHCTRELKTAAIRSFLKYIGWGTWRDYKTIIGYRADEPKRTKLKKLKELNQYWPLWEWGIKKPDVAYFWNRQPFDLGMYQPKGEEFVDADGNCEGCYKKSDLKLIYQAKSNPSGAEWIREMERKYQYNTAGRDGEGMPYRFFRDSRTLDEIIEQYPEITSMSIENIKKLLDDKSLLEDGASYDLVEQLNCEESCEAFTELED